MTKLAHSEVEYGPGKPHAHCSLCEHFEMAGPHCEIVADPIEPAHWCDRFSLKPAAEIERRLSTKDK